MSANWKAIATAPRDGLPFLLGTSSGGIMIEFWHFCLNSREIKGCYSDLTLGQLRARAPTEQFLWSRPEAPKAIA